MTSSGRSGTSERHARYGKIVSGPLIPEYYCKDTQQQLSLCLQRKSKGRKDSKKKNKRAREAPKLPCSVIFMQDQGSRLQSASQVRGWLSKNSWNCESSVKGVERRIPKNNTGLMAARYRQGANAKCSIGFASWRENKTTQQQIGSSRMPSWRGSVGNAQSSAWLSLAWLVCAPRLHRPDQFVRAWHPARQGRSSFLILALHRR